MSAAHAYVGGVGKSRALRVACSGDGVVVGASVAHATVAEEFTLSGDRFDSSGSL
jgi:hypothetical protein